MHSGGTRPFAKACLACYRAGKAYRRHDFGVILDGRLALSLMSRLLSVVCGGGGRGKRPGDAPPHAAAQPCADSDRAVGLDCGFGD